MSPLETLIQQYLSGLSAVYFIRQLIVILCLFVFGGILTDLFEKGCTSRVRRATLAFPAGLSAFSVTAYAMLVIGIPYNSLTVMIAIALETAAALFARRKSSDPNIDRTVIKHMLIILAVATLIGVVAVSGIAPVSISNDSMYFFRRYPDVIVYYGKLRDQFDFWLTDTGAWMCEHRYPSFAFRIRRNVRDKGVLPY